MKDMGYGKDYKYAHEYPEHFVEQQHLPDSLKGKKFYTPGKLGFENQILDRIRNLRGKKVQPENPKGPALDEPDTEK